MLIDWITAITTIILAILALFQDRIRNWMTRPKFDIVVNMQPPDCHRITIVREETNSQKQADSYYFRLRVKNVSNFEARVIEIFASILLKQNIDGSFSQVETFLPMNLLWTHIKKPSMDLISPGMEKLCDLGYIFEPSKRSEFKLEDNPKLRVPNDKYIFSFDLENKPMTMSHLLPPGKYRLELLIGASNSKAVKKVLEINATGNWYETEQEMFSNGISIKAL